MSSKKYRQGVFTPKNGDKFEANPNRTFGEAFDEDKNRISSGLLIKQIIESKGKEGEKSPYASRESGKGFHFKINSEDIKTIYEYPVKFPNSE